MKKTLFIQIIILFFSVSAVLSAQSLSHVSQVRMESRNNLIRITWVDSPDARGPVYIYRSIRPFSGSIPANIKPVVVRYGVQYYIDDVEDIASLFYFIAASDNSGRIYETIIPSVNSISINLSQVEQIPGADQRPDLISGTNWMPGLTNLWTRREGSKVVITYTASNSGKNVVLYRSMMPISQPQDLINAVIVQSGIISPFIDSPVFGRPWYYAVIYEDEIISGNIRIRPGINATTSAIIIYDDRTEENFLRPMPLPFLTLNNYMSGGFLKHGSQEMPLNTQRQNMTPLELKTPRVLQ